MSRKINDFYETPEHYVDALNARLLLIGSIFEPCVGDGSLLRYLNTEDNTIFTNDLDSNREADYHFNAAWEPAWPEFINPDWIITNPPFSDIESIVKISWKKCKTGIIMLCRLSFLEPTNTRVEILKSLNISELIILPRHSFTGTGNDSMTCCWIVARKDYNGSIIDFVGRK